MKTYAALSFVLMVLSLCIIDEHIQPAVAKVGRACLVIFGVLFVITETIYLVT